MRTLKKGACKYCSTPITKEIVTLEDGSEEINYVERKKDEPVKKNVTVTIDGNFTIKIDKDNKECVIDTRGTLVRSYLYCANCNERLFKNMTSVGTASKVCDNCNFNNIFNFNM